MDEMRGETDDREMVENRMGKEENTKDQGTDSYPSLLKEREKEEGREIGSSPDRLMYSNCFIFSSEEMFEIKHIRNILPEVDES